MRQSLNGASLTPQLELPTTMDAFLSSSEKYANRIDGITLNCCMFNVSIISIIPLDPGSLFGSITMNFFELLIMQ